MGQENPSEQDDSATATDKGGSAYAAVPVTAPTGEQRDQNDERGLRHGREVHVGFPVGRYLQPPPFFFTRDKWPAPLVDMYRGGSAFLIAGGPSFANIDHNRLREPGILTFGINNSVKTFRPNMWTCVDDPANFIRSTWLDPKIMKFSPMGHIDKPIFNSDKWRFMNRKVGDCPNVWYYKRNERFKADQYLHEDTINWGNHTNMGGGRSVLLAAVRILYMLGIRRVFLLGVDLDMSSDKKYHFSQDRSPGSIKGNNSTYKLLQERFTQLRPYFDEAGFNVFNCNPESKLTAFDYMSFDDAMKIARFEEFPEDVSTERTDGLYDRKANEGKKGQPPALPPRRERNNTIPGQPAARGKPCTNCSRKSVEQIREQTSAARNSLHEAKQRTAAMRLKKENNDPEFDESELLRLIEDENRKRTVFRQIVSIRNDMMGIK